ncbi:CHRD domain-containing protein [Flavobacterium sp. ZB4P13]|uniref:CHRD domain-containing protein n=1 Tax=Flavobacterium sp. ZB4P13 TaxID=3401728 RepID=UPI003AB0F17F
MKHLFRFLAIPFFLLGIASCNNSDDDPKPSTTTFNATLNGTSEVPSNTSSATGTATLTFNNTTKTFTITVTHSVASATGGHIHVGAAGTAPPNNVVFPFTNLTSPITYTSVALTTAQEADLKANLYYVNIHSAAYPGGEIRGQLIKGNTSGGGGGY